MVHDNGTVYAADGRGRCARISRDGQTGFYGDLDGAPNGICLDNRGNCIIANIGNGQVQSLSPDGRHEVLLTEVDGKRMTSPNFPFMDQKGRLWVSNSTYQNNPEAALQKPEADGCVVMIENGQSKIMTEGIYFANGLTLDADEKNLYVAQTMQRNILRYAVQEDGRLGPAEIFGPDPLAPLGFPDGVAFDEAGNLWVTFPSLNGVGFITPRGKLEMVLEDPDQRVLKRPSNICFGWKDRKTAFIGSLDGSNIPYFEVPYPGMKLIHQK